MIRQQLHADDGKKLAGFLNLQTKKVKNYDVFIFELCDGNISKVNNGSQATKNFTVEESVEICKQLIEGLQQLEKSNKCHNDLKPENILFKASRDLNEDRKITIKICDFGTAGRSGGTPGWTWPRFLSERKPGRSDMYSTGLLMLYVMCETRDLFYRLRDNYVDSSELWLEKFRKEPLIELVIDMMELRITVQQCQERWDEISDSVELLTEFNLCMEFKVPRYWFEVQDGMNRNGIQVAKATHLDK